MSVSRKPYLIRAMHEWISDCNHTPHLVIDATVANVVVPSQHVSDGKIILNVGLNATSGLDLGNEQISFSTRFSGKVQMVQLPCAAVIGIYARETGEGMIFTDDDSDPGDEPPSEPPTRPTLKVVK